MQSQDQDPTAPRPLHLCMNSRRSKSENRHLFLFGPPNNGNEQIATAAAVITVAPGCQARLTVDWLGLGEEHEKDFERMTNLVDEVEIVNAHSPGTGGEMCASGMGSAVPRSGSPVPPQEILLNPGFHRLEIATTTGDFQYHWGAFYELDFTLQPQ